MSATLSRLGRLLMLGVAIAVACGACSLQRVGGWIRYAEVQPQQFCGGETIRASYDYLTPRTCPAGLDCSLFHPRVRISSTPEVFPADTFTDYAGGVNFTATGDRIEVLFDVDRGHVLIPTDQFDDRGNRTFMQLEVRDETHVAERQQPFYRALPHEGMCMGDTPTYAIATLPAAPEFSPLLRMGELCNDSSVPIIATLTAEAVDGSLTTRSERLGIGACLNTSAPSMFRLRRTRIVEVRPESPDPMARCTGLGPYQPPQPLATRVRMQCL